MPSCPPPTPGALRDAAAQVAKHYRAHGGYGSEATACRALARRCPGASPRRCRNAFRKALALYDAAADIVGRDIAALARQTDVAADRFPSFRDQLPALRRRCPGFRAATYRSLLLWVFYWHHLR